MEIATTKNIVANGVVTANELSCSVRVEFDFDTLGEGPARGKVECTPADKDRLERIFERFTFSIDAEQIGGQPIRIREAHASEHSETQMESYTFEIFEGETDAFDATQGSLDCDFIFPLNPALAGPIVTTMSHTGAVHATRGEDDAVKLELRIGSARLTDGFQYIRRKNGDETVQVELRRCFLFLHVNTNGNTSFPTLLETFDSELEDVFWLISFLGRKRVHWYDLKMRHIVQRETTPEFRDAQVHRFASDFSEAKEPISDFYEGRPLIDTKKLAEGTFQSLFDAVTGSPIRRDLRRAKMFLLASYHRRHYFEFQLVALYTALEILVAALSRREKQELTLPKPQFVQLRQKIEKALDELLGTDIVTKDKVKRKIPELQRRTFHERLLELLQQQDVKLDDLWPEHTDIGAELKGVLQRRNQLIHLGADYSQQYANDLYRLRVILERWLLKLMNCPDDVVSARAFDKALMSTLQARE